MANPIPVISPEITLIANSGVQFYQLQVNMNIGTPAYKKSAEYFEKTVPTNDGGKEITYVFVYFHSKLNCYIELTDEIKRIATDSSGIIDEAKIPNHLIKKIKDEQVNTSRGKDAIDSYEEVWIPLPYFRKSFDNKKFQPGPETWAMVWLRKIPDTIITDESTLTHNVVLAFDTRCAANNGDKYLTPDLKDAEGASFECVTDPNYNFFFCSRTWILEWLKANFDKTDKLKNRKQEFQFLFMNFYLTLLKALEAAGTFPKVQMVGAPKINDKFVSNEVDLILDVGNSRTCGILTETLSADQPFDFTESVPLRIRDLSKPDLSYTEPFDMRMAMVKPNLGEESAIIISGNKQMFSWPSIARIGDEAMRWAVLESGEGSNAIMSSPKRYLWDTSERQFPWTYISSRNEPFAKPALHGITEQLTDEGKFVKKEMEKFLDPVNENSGLKPPYPAIYPLFPRGSMMLLAMAEIFLHAITYVNSFEYRKRKGQERIPRKLKRIVITCPTAMPQVEQKILREHARDAIEALKTYFNESFIDNDLLIIPDPDDIIRPEEMRDKKKEWAFDEATCSQLAFVYSEIKDRFMNDAKLYINTVGRQRADSVYKNLPAVTVASIDIGGGTTDLMIMSYQADPQADISRLIPKPLCWEGFNLAGDNVLKRVIERIVLPNISIYAKKCGCANPTNIMTFLFGPYVGDLEAKDRRMKRQFANQIAVPIGFGILNHSAEDRDDQPYSFDSFFENFPYPSEILISYINKKFRDAGAANFDLKKISFALNKQGISKVGKDVLEKMIGDLCGIVSQYHCDFVLLSGRPTNLSVVRDLFLKYLPTGPDKIVQMGNYRIGTWYPFAKGIGIIKDPKTCVAVGATVALMSGTLSRLKIFSLDTTLMREIFDSTADYIGQYQPNSSHLSSMFFDPNTDYSTVKFYGYMVLGMRQMPIDSWISAPLYEITFSTNEYAAQYKNKVPITFDIERNPRDKEGIRSLKNIMTNTNQRVPTEAIRVKLKTLVEEHGHWLDTGIFLVQLITE